MNLQVGVRVRPYNKIDISRNVKICVGMDQNNVQLFDSQDKSQIKNFLVDQCFWSFDGFKQNQKGYFQPITDQFADQQKIFNKVGKPLLEKFVRGQNCNFIAYGENAAGKTYTTFGLDQNEGIVYYFARQISKFLQDQKKADVKYVLNLAMFQIYLQRIEDLFIPLKQRPKQRMKIRQSQKSRIYIENLSKKQINSYQQLKGYIKKGLKQKNIADVCMSRLSCRGHTFVQFQLTKITMFQKQQSSQISYFQFIDLAGSQKISKTGVSSSVLNEVKSISKSLCALKVVVQALGKKKNQDLCDTKIFVPYRDSVLTRLLQNSFSNQQNIFFMFLISPSDQSYDQTLSTLRFCQRVKKIGMPHAKIQQKSQKQKNNGWVKKEQTKN